MRTYHPESYSAQARKLAGILIRQFEAGKITDRKMVRFTQVSYRHPLIRRRMAKMFYRYFRKHNLEIPCGLTEEEAYLAW